MSADDLPLCLAIWGVHPSWPKIPTLPIDKHATTRDGAVMAGGRIARRNAPKGPVR